MAKITSEQLSLMVSDIVKQVDYDIWKEFYVYGEEDETIELEDIAEKHLNLMGVYVE